jgi:hypothetical protein
MWEDALEFVIVGTTAAGETFRPSDWADRLSGMMSIFGEDRHLSYSPYLKPVLAAGVRCVVVDRELERIDPAAWKFLLGFARDNELSLRPGRKRQRPEDVTPGPPSVPTALEGLSASRQGNSD